MDARSWHVRSPRWLIRTEWHRACESQKAGRSKSPSEFKCASLACSGTLATFFITPVKPAGEEKKGRRGIKSRGSREERVARFRNCFFQVQLFFADSSDRDGGGGHVVCTNPEAISVTGAGLSSGLPDNLRKSLSVLCGSSDVLQQLQQLQMVLSGFVLRLLISISTDFWRWAIGINVNISARDARRPVCPITWRAKWFYVKCFSNKVRFCRKRRSMLVDSIKISPPLRRRSCQRPLHPVNSLGLREEALIRAWQTKRYQKRYQFCCLFVSAIFIVYRIIVPFFMCK